jgi:hypothetical protein
MTAKKIVPYIFLVLLAIAALFLKRCRYSSTKTKEGNTEEVAINKRGLNRNPSQINYSKHAKCRMECRHIDESEVNDMLKNGTVNYKKSDLKGDDCHKRYAVEGISKDNQRLRIVFAPCNSEVTVVTCIDLSQEWECHCPGDENK